MPLISWCRWTVQVEPYCPKAAVRGHARRRIPVGVVLLIALCGCGNPFFPGLSQADLCDAFEDAIVHAENVLERRYAERGFDEKCVRSDTADPDEERKKRPKKDAEGGDGEIGESLYPSADSLWAAMRAFYGSPRHAAAFLVSTY